MEGIACEARRWRGGKYAADGVQRPDGSGPYAPWCYRRVSRPVRARPTDEQWAGAMIGVPSLGSGGWISWRWRQLGSLLTYLTTHE